MKKFWTWFAVIVALVAALVYYAMKTTEPLQLITSEMSRPDYQSAVIGIGNRGLRDVQIIEVTVNDHEKPLESKMQLSNAVKGLIATKDFSKVEEGHIFKEIGEVPIKSGSSKNYYERSEEGTLSEEDELIGINVIHDEVIKKINIEYKHFGITYHFTMTYIES